MKKIISLFSIILAFVYASSDAQVRTTPKQMTYIVAAKPNMIIYHDSVFNGVKQFESLFYRTQDVELIRYVQKHQSNKITGQVLGLVGTITTIIGIGQLSSDHKGLAWGMIGGGFAATLTSGYLLLMGQRNLQMAVTLFNQRYSQASLGIGVGSNTAGLVYKF